VTWTCSRCDRRFRQVNQRHACGVGSRSALLKNRPPALVDLYGKLEATVRGFGAVEVVTRDRYALFRTTRIFTDLTVMRDRLRVVIHLGREVKAPYFIKVGRGDKRVSHVAMIRTSAELRVITPLLREAYELAAGEESSPSLA
jgi:predicted transport protein